MALELVAWNPPRKKHKKTAAKKAGRKARRAKVAKTRHRKHHKHRRAEARTNPPARTPTPSLATGGPKMAKHKKRRSESLNSAVPRSGRKHRGGGGGTSLKSLLSGNALITGASVGAAVVGSQIATQMVLDKVLPDKANNVYVVTAAQIGIGVLGAFLLGKAGGGMKKYAEAWMTGSTASAAVNLYGYFRAQQQLQHGGGQITGGDSAIAGLFGLAGGSGRFTRNGSANFQAA